MENSTDATDYNGALRGADNVSLALGGGLISIGGGVMVAGEAIAATGAVATVTSGGTASPVSVLFLIFLL